MGSILKPEISKCDLLTWSFSGAAPGQLKTDQSNDNFLNTLIFIKVFDGAMSLEMLNSLD